MIRTDLTWLKPLTRRVFYNLNKTRIFMNIVIFTRPTYKRSKTTSLTTSAYAHLKKLFQRNIKYLRSFSPWLTIVVDITILCSRLSRLSFENSINSQFIHTQKLKHYLILHFDIPVRIYNDLLKFQYSYTITNFHSFSIQRLFTIKCKLV